MARELSPPHGLETHLCPRAVPFTRLGFDEMSIQFVAGSGEEQDTA